LNTGKAIDGDSPSFESYDKSVLWTGGNGSKLSFAAFLRMPAAATTQQMTIVTNSGLFIAFFNFYDGATQNNLMVSLYRQTSPLVGASIVSAGKDVHGIEIGDWFTLMYSIDFSGAAPVYKMWAHKKGVLDAVDIGANPYTEGHDTGPVTFDFDDTTYVLAIGSHPNYVPEAANYEGSEFFLTDEAIDWSDEHIRARYVTRWGMPRGLGSDGSRLTGTQPRYYMPDYDGTNNLGSEGNFTEVGTISDSATTPSYE
jgi:hypothetical protein